MQELIKLHPKVKWVIRVHSEIPFLANEGNSVGWLYQYTKLGVTVSFNSTKACADFAALAHSIYLPNFYPLHKRFGIPDT